MHKIKHNDRQVGWYRKWDKHLKKRAGIRQAHLSFNHFFDDTNLPMLSAPITARENWMQKLWRRFQQFVAEYRQPSYAN